jgi:hypothetical protein
VADGRAGPAVRLVIDVTGELGNKKRADTHRTQGGGVALGGMPLHRVRMF